MAKRKPFLLRLDPQVHEGLRRWADDDLRSLNAQIEFLLRKALREAGRLRSAELSADPPADRGKAVGTDDGDD